MPAAVPPEEGMAVRVHSSGACATASVTSSQVSKRRPARVRERSTFQHGSIRLS